MKTILFPTDFSMNSIHAIRYGLELFKEERDMHYILFNAYIDPSTGASMTMVWEDHMNEISRQMLETLHEKLIDDYGHSDLTAECVSQYGDLPDALKPILEKRKVDLIVMGSSGAGGPNISMFGSNAYATMKDAPCPVLTVPLQSSIKAPHRIGLASEIRLKGDEDFLQPLNDMAETLNCNILGIQVTGESNASDGNLESEPTAEDGETLDYIQLENSDPLVGIESAIGVHDLDMLAIIIKKRNLLDRIFHKSVSKSIAKNIALPILSLHS